MSAVGSLPITDELLGGSENFKKCKKPVHYSSLLLCILFGLLRSLAVALEKGANILAVKIG